MKELLQRSWKKRGCRSRKEIFAAEVVRSILLRRMEDIWCLLKCIISKVAMFYLIAHGYRELPPCRFDVVGINGENIHWIKNAFDFCS